MQKTSCNTAPLSEMHSLLWAQIFHGIDMWSHNVLFNLFSFSLTPDRIQAIRVDSSSFWSDGVIFRCANQPLISVVPCFLQDFVNQVIIIIINFIFLTSISLAVLGALQYHEKLY